MVVHLTGEFGMSKVWFVTGSSRGLGRSFVETAFAAGDRVAATARKPERLNDLVDRYGDALLPIALDETVETFGRIDVVAE
jgi:NAD(P)-dependent dehydrogenase (short-subunit alcohol dehydrogenase family)